MCHVRALPAAAPVDGTAASAAAARKSDFRTGILLGSAAGRDLLSSLRQLRKEAVSRAFGFVMAMHGSRQEQIGRSAFIAI
jgi:hypothetical protein